jgi:phosphopantothenoylcysteine decarboxylase / phosphopantothenate---cysteine ligase
MKILLGITGGIAAYKSCNLCSMALKNGHEVKVVMTNNATKFIGPITFEGLTGKPVLTNTFENAMDHIQWAKWADIVTVAPLSANSLAKVAMGICDNLLLTLICATPQNTPILLYPAMNTQMWETPITQRNIRWINESQRFTLLDPVEKRLACGDFGIGALPEPTEILKKIEEICQL